MDELMEYLNGMAQLMKTQPRPEGFLSRPELLLKYGRPFETDENTYEGPRGTPKECYCNAGRIALDDPDLAYVEGIIAHIIPIDHAWLVNRKTGKVVDPTLKDGSHAKAYFGIPFSTRYLSQTTFKTMVWGLIHHTNPGLFKGEISSRDFMHKDYRDACAS